MDLTLQFLKLHLRPLWLPVTVLALAAWMAPLGANVPSSYAGLWQTGPYLMLVVLVVLGVSYSRGRAVLTALALVLSTAVLDQTGPLPDSLTATFPLWMPVLVAGVLVPLNLVVTAFFRERGVFTSFGLVRLIWILAPIAALFACLVFWPQQSRAAWSQWSADWIDFAVLPAAMLPLTESLTNALALLAQPQANLAVLLLCAIAIGVAAYRNRSHFNFALLVGYLGYVGGVLPIDQPELFRAMGIAIGFIFCISILRDAHNMAYRDELTGLPQRRALNELFMALGGDYAVAMLDVDHFKKFNDTHGHETGDDVLKMVASQIARVKDGGRAFRYGGEEFTVVYPGKVKEQALRSLELVRASIEGYAMVVRPPRPTDADKTATAKRGKGSDADSRQVSVTISIGVADRTDRNDAPAAVLKKADEALYQAKREGRNRTILWGSEPAPAGRKRKRGAAV